MSSGSTASATLPDISSTKASLVEAITTKDTRSSPACLSTTGCSVPNSRLEPSSAPALLLGRRASPQAATTPRAGTSPAQYVPRPPSTSPREGTAIKPRRVLEYVRLSRSEIDHKDQAIASLRSENVQLQATIRELRSVQGAHATLQSACADVAQCLGCTVEGVAAESIRDILYNHASSVLRDRQHVMEQLKGSQAELERSKCEAAAANVKVSSLETQLQQARAALVSRDSEIQGMKTEVDRLQQNEARNSTVLQSLRQRLTELDDQRRGEERLTELHTEIGRLKRALNEKDESLQGVRGQLEASQAEKEDLQERVISLEEMYDDLCTQLVTALRLEETDTHDVDSLIAEIGRLSQEYPQLKLRTDTLTKTLKACELDSRASRETILRLVSEAKKQEKLATQLAELQQAKEELESLLGHLERERDSYQERLVAAKETMAAQEEEIQAKDARIRELVSTWHSLKATYEAESDLVSSEQQKYEELCKAVGSLIGSSSNDAVELLQALEQVIQTQQRLSERLAEREEEEVEGGRARSSLQTRLTELEEELENERSKVKQLEGELVTTAVVKEGMEKDAEKEQQFYQRVSKALKMDSTTSRVLTGDFARDAILIRAEQMTKQETQALAEKQSAFYAAQRQLKTCRQSLTSKELYVTLLQKKTASLEERVQEMTQRESQLQDMAGKSVKLERQVERLKSKMTQQTEELERFRSENTKMALLQSQCAEQESELRRLSERVEELNQARSDQAQQLAEARVRVQSVANRERQDDREMKGEMRHLREQLGQAKDSKQKFSTFRVAVQKLLSSSRGDSSTVEEAKRETPSDYDLMAQLEQLVADYRELRDMVKCLGPSLQQLEQGFKTGYSDALTILQTKA